MFGDTDSKAVCPVDAATGSWIDRRWTWLTQQFGADRLKKARVILPRPEFFPDRYDGTEEDARKLLDRIAGYMGLDSTSVNLSLYEDRTPTYDGETREGTAGLYHQDGDQFQIWIETSNLNDPAGLISTLAHELAHIHLLGHGRVSPDEDDHERLTDLLTVYLGLGVLTANSVVHERYWDQGGYSGWSIGKRGYLTMQAYGYALALFARDRGEDDPDWAEVLRLDVRDSFDKSLRFLAIGQPHQELESAATAASQEPDGESLELDDAPETDRTLTDAEFVQKLASGERDFANCILRDCNLKGLDLRDCRFCEADFDHADLTDADLSECDLHEADLQDATLLRTRLCGSNLRGADFTSACLIGTDLTGADIRGADFSDAILDGAILNATKRDRSTDLSSADVSGIVCDSDLRLEDLSGSSNLEGVVSGFDLFADILILVVAVILTSMIGWLCGGFVGEMVGRAINLPVLSQFLAACGAICGVVLGYRLRMRLWRLRKRKSAEADE